MKITCFASGSSGNAFLVQAGATSVLVDAGLGVRILRQQLAALDVHDGGLSAIFISHEHSDHVAGLARLVRYHPAPVLATEGTLRAAGDLPRGDRERLVAGLTVEVGELRVTPVEVPHDAYEPVGFVLEHGAVRVALFTDLGSVTPDVCSAVRDAALVVLESNYDEEMLARGPYPAHLKRRIRGGRGHLSNSDCAAALAAHLNGATRDVWLAHLSQNNNRPPLARSAAEASVRAGQVEVRTLPRSGTPLSWDSAEATTRPMQLDLFGGR